MKRKLFILVMIISIMCGYTSCESEMPQFDTELTDSEKVDIIYTVQQSIQGGTFRCEALNSELYFKPSTKSTFISYELRGDIINPEWFPQGFASYSLDVNSDYTIKHRDFESLQWKVVNSNTLEGLHSFNKGIWRRIK